MLDNAVLPALAFAPWRLSGTVYGTLLNDPAQWAALGAAAHAAPYKAPPRAPVLYVKPRNTLAGSGAHTVVPADAGEFIVGASLGIVIGRVACRVQASAALDFIAGWALVADLHVPHDSYYRPSVRHRARDCSCVIAAVAPRTAIADPDALRLRVSINDDPAIELGTAGMERPVARLLKDVTEFMTLLPGDILLLGVAHKAPRARAGDSYRITCPGLGSLRGELIAEHMPSTAQAAA